jgi:hypothetical protein
MNNPEIVPIGPTTQFPKPSHKIISVQVRSNSSTMGFSIFKRLRKQAKVSSSDKNADNNLKLQDSDVDGAFFTTIPHLEEASTSSADSDSSTSTNMSWQSSGKAGHHKHSPLVARRADYSPLSPSEPIDEVEELGLIMARSRKLPGTWYYSSNHVMVNQERMKRIIPPLLRESDLDELAREHAAAMASSKKLFHSDPSGLLFKVSGPSRRLGENVAKGANIREIHNAMMELKGDRNNMLDRRYTNFGMGTAQGSNGELYLCQIFRG